MLATLTNDRGAFTMGDLSSSEGASVYGTMIHGARPGSALLLLVSPAFAYSLASIRCRPSTRGLEGMAAIISREMLRRASEDV